MAKANWNVVIDDDGGNMLSIFTPTLSSKDVERIRSVAGVSSAVNDIGTRIAAHVNPCYIKQEVIAEIGALFEPPDDQNPSKEDK